MRNPTITSVAPFSPVWSGFQDGQLRPTLLVAREGSGYRPMNVTDFGGNINITGIVPVTITGIINNEQVTQLAASGNIDTANKAFIDDNGRLYVRTSPVPPLQDVFTIVLTGVTFNNYSATVPNISGNMMVSLEPHSDNADSIYYAFNSSATTGNAWELRGDRSFEVSGLRNLYYSTAVSGQKVMVHYQKF